MNNSFKTKGGEGIVTEKSRVGEFIKYLIGDSITTRR
jgi:hypothetical protein